MNDILLITVDDIKEVTSISKNIQPDLLEPYILVAEEFYVYPILGQALVSEIKNQLTGNTLTKDNINLLNGYIKRLVAYGAWEQYLPFSASKTTQKGEQILNSNFSQSVDAQTFSTKRQNLKSQVTIYQSRLQRFLNQNETTYPLYRRTCGNSGLTNGYGTGIYLG